MKHKAKLADETATQSQAAQRKAGAQSGSERAQDIANSPAMTAQRRRLESMFGSVAQRVEEEEPLQGRFETAQRVEEEEPLQGKFAGQGTAQLQDDSAPPNRTGLPDNLKSGVESLSGMSLDHVRVHYNSSQPASLQAHAYAQGSDIHVGPGQEQHLPHEAWHVVQQAQGRVQPTMQMNDGVPVNDDRHLENEADVMGAKAMQMKDDGGHG